MRWHIGMAGASAILLGLAFPSPGWSWLIYIALTPLGVLAVRTARPKRLAWTVWLVFFCWWLVMIRWMAPVTMGGYIALSAFEALFAMVAALALYVLARKGHAPMVLALPAVWASLELLRGVFPFGGFSWFSLGHATLPYLPNQGAPHVAQIADLFGQYAVSFVVAMTSGVIVDLLTLPLMRRNAARRVRPRRMILVALTAWLAVLLASYFYGGYRIAQYASVTKPALRVAVVQTNQPQSNKIAPTAQQEAAYWTRLLDLANKAADAKPKPGLIVWPETMVPAPLNASAQKVLREVASPAVKYENQVAAFAGSHDVNLLVGSETLTDWQQTTTPDGRVRFHPDRRYNSAYLYRPDGKLANRYDKIHLVPFGEYIPIVESSPTLKHWFIEYLSPYGFDYTTDPGTHITMFHVQTVSNANRNHKRQGRQDAKTPRKATENSEKLVGRASRPPSALVDPRFSPSAKGGRDARPTGGNFLEAPGASPPSPQIHFTTPICFEDTIAPLCRSMIYGPHGHKRAQLLVNLTNDGWFVGTDEPAQHIQIAAMRCIEDRVPMARSVNTGISGFIDSVGRVREEVTNDGKHTQVAGVASRLIRTDDRSTLYGELGRWPITLMALLTFAWVVLSLTRWLPRRG